MPKIVSEAEIAHRHKVVTKGYKDGVAVKKIGKALSLHPTSINSIARELKLTHASHKAKPFSQEMIDRINELEKGELVTNIEIDRILREEFPERNWGKDSLDTIARHRKIPLTAQESSEAARNTKLGVEIENRPFIELLTLNEDYNKRCSALLALILCDGQVAPSRYHSFHDSQLRESPTAKLEITHAEDQKDLLSWGAEEIIKPVIGHAPPICGPYVNEDKIIDPRYPTPSKCQDSFKTHSCFTRTFAEFLSCYSFTKYKSGKTPRWLKVRYPSDEILKSIDVYYFLFAALMDDGSFIHSNESARRAGEKYGYPEAYKHGGRLAFRLAQIQTFDSELERLMDILKNHHGLPLTPIRSTVNLAETTYKSFLVDGKKINPPNYLRGLWIQYDFSHSQLIPRFRQIAEELNFPKELLEYKLKNCSVENCLEVKQRLDDRANKITKFKDPEGNIHEVKQSKIGEFTKKHGFSRAQIYQMRKLKKTAKGWSVTNPEEFEGVSIMGSHNYAWNEN